MRKKIIFIISISILLCSWVSAETLTLTIDEAVKRTLDQNLSLKNAFNTLRTKERVKKTAWNVFLPSISARSQVGLKNEFLAPSGFSDPGNFSLQASATASLPMSIATIPALKKIRMDYAAGLLDYQSAVKNMEKEVRKLFYQILSNRESIQIQQTNIALAQKRYDQAVTNYRTGLFPQIDVLAAEVSLLQLKPDLNTTVQGYNNLMLQLKSIIGVDRTSEVILDGELPSVIYNDLDAEQLIKDYAAKRFDVQSLEKQIASLKANKTAVAFQSNLPSLNLSYTWLLNASNAESTLLGASIDPFEDRADTGTLALGLTWKLDGLIPGSSTWVQIKGIKDSIDSMENQRISMRINAEVEITQLVGIIQISRLSIEANSNGQELAKKRYELTEEAYRLGTRQLLDVESAQKDYLEAQQRLLMARYNYISSILDLEYALNTPMQEFLENGETDSSD